jgi:hypothetical protein
MAKLALVAATMLACALVSVSQTPTGCEKMMTQYCPNWKTEGAKACIACCTQHEKQLQSNCTVERCVRAMHACSVHE